MADNLEEQSVWIIQIANPAIYSINNPALILRVNNQYVIQPHDTGRIGRII
jgi:hypothetical protein